MLVRLALGKYRGRGKLDTSAKALEMLINENVIGYYTYEDPESLRLSKFWTKPVATLLKNNEPLIQQLFSRMMGRQKYLGIDSAYAAF